MEYSRDSDPDFEALLKEREEIENERRRLDERETLLLEKEKSFSSSKQDSVDFGSLEQIKVDGSKGMNLSSASESDDEIVRIITEVKTSDHSLHPISSAKSIIEESKSDLSANSSMAESFPSRTCERIVLDLSVSISNDSNSSWNAQIVDEQKIVTFEHELFPMTYIDVDHYLKSVTTQKSLLTKVLDTIGSDDISEGKLASRTMFLVTIGVGVLILATLLGLLFITSALTESAKSPVEQPTGWKFGGNRQPDRYTWVSYMT
jgi:hypothetical protein